MEEWWAVANGPAIWISGFALAGVAIIAGILMQTQAIREAKKIGFGHDKVKEVRRATMVTCIGPCLGITFGMIPLLIALSPGMAWLRESAGIGSIQYELITATQGAAAVGEKLGPGISVLAFVSALFVMSTGGIPWIIMGMVYTPIAKTMVEKSKKGDAKAVPLIVTVMMIIVFGEIAAARTMPIFKDGQISKPFVAALLSAICTIVIFVAADRLKKPQLKEYALVIAMLVGMFGAYFIMGGLS